MGFGKRGLPRQPQSASRSGADDDADLDLQAMRDKGSRGGISPVLIVAMVVVSVALGAAAALVYGSMFAGSGQSLAAAQRKGTGAHDRIADRCMPPAGRGLRRVGVTDEEFRYQGALRSPAYFTCALALEPERFCGADEKALLVMELQTYFGYIAAKQRIIDRYSDDPSAKRMMKMAAAVEAQDGGISSGRRPVPDAFVVELMRGLVRDGYLSTGDFGWSVPAEIGVHLKDVDADKSSC